jgi:predicted alpha/beta-fold hydrolase
MNIEKLMFYGTSTMMFDPEAEEAMILICCEGTRNMLMISFGMVGMSLGARVTPMLLTEEFQTIKTEVDIQLIDPSSNDLLVKALGNDTEAKETVANLFGQSLALVAYEVIACRTDSNQLPDSIQ